MKLNKSILGLVILSVFILSSCSQARYGSMTRRVKSVKTEHEVVKQKRQSDEVEGKSLSAAKSVKPVSTASKQSVQDDAVYTSEQVAEVLEVDQKIDVETNGRISQNKRRKILSTLNKSGVQLNSFKNLKDFPARKLEAKSLASKTNGDVDSLLYIILVVILVLLILSLISKLFPFLNWILGVALLILLIYILLQVI
jgi:Flp pilus assembly protein TadB